MRRGTLSDKVFLKCALDHFIVTDLLEFLMNLCHLFDMCRTCLQPFGGFQAFRVFCHWGEACWWLQFSFWLFIILQFFTLFIFELQGAILWPCRALLVLILKDWAVGLWWEHIVGERGLWRVWWQIHQVLSLSHSIRCKVIVCFPGIVVNNLPWRRLLAFIESRLCLSTTLFTWDQERRCLVCNLLKATHYRLIIFGTFCLDIVYHRGFIVVLPCFAIVVVDHRQLTNKDLIVPILSTYLLARLLERIVVADLCVL